MNQRYIIRAILAILMGAILLGMVIAAVFTSSENCAAVALSECMLT